MFFITKDGVKDWKEGDAWYKPASIEGYEASTPSTGMSKGLKIFLYTFIALIVLCLIAGLLAFLAKKMQEK